MAIVLEKLLNHPRFRGNVGKKKLAQYRAEDTEIENDLSDAEQVLCLAWDGDLPGNSDAIWISRWAGFYFVSSSDYDPEGPFESLSDALDLEWFSIVTSKPALVGRKISKRRLLEIGRRLIAEEGDEIRINEQLFVLKGGRLVDAEIVH